MSAKIAFELQKLHLPLESILPAHVVKDPENIERYGSIRNSIPQQGLIEPLMIFPIKGQPGMYILVDGHLRYLALKELGITSADCIIATDDECFTYNARISRLAPIQEHRMIVQAVKNGVSPEKIATALNLPVSRIKSSMNLLKGIDERAAELIKDKYISPVTIRLLKKVNGPRQLEIVETMKSANNFSSPYAELLIITTPKEQLANPEATKKPGALSAEDSARLQQEMEVLQHDFKDVQVKYSEDVLTLTVLQGYVRRLLDQAKVVRFLTANYPEYLVEFESLAAMEAF